MTRIASFDGLPRPGSLGFTAKRTGGSLSRTIPGSVLTAAAERRTSAFERSGRLATARGAAPLTFSAVGLGIGLAVTAAFTSGLFSAASTAAGSLLRDSQRRGKVRVSPAALHLRCTPARPPEAAEPVSVLIAMRHEPDAAVAALRAALSQRGVDHLDIVVLDDGCPQETRTALRREFADDPRVRILAAAPLPRGWSPHAHRYHQLAVAARGRVLIFAEPSAPLGPHAAAAATALLRGERLDLAVLDTGRPAPTPPRTPPGRRPETRPAARSRAEAQPPAAPPSRCARDCRQGPGQGPGQLQGVPGGDGAGTRPVMHRPHARHGSGRANGTTGTRRTGRIHPGRFAVAVDADAYWRFGGYRAAATDPDPLALLRTVRRASGRAAVADGRRVIPPAQLLEPLPPPEPEAEALWESRHSSRASLTGTARRVLAALVGSRA